jgi:hypothetical protein
VEHERDGLLLLEGGEGGRSRSVRVLGGAGRMLFEYWRMGELLAVLGAVADSGSSVRAAVETVMVHVGLRRPETRRSRLETEF